MTALTIIWGLNPCFVEPSFFSRQLSLYQEAFQSGKLIWDSMSCNPCLFSNLTADLNCVEHPDRGQKAQLQAFLSHLPSSTNQQTVLWVESPPTSLVSSAGCLVWALLGMVHSKPIPLLESRGRCSWKAPFLQGGCESTRMEGYILPVSETPTCSRPFLYSVSQAPHL